MEGKKKQDSDSEDEGQKMTVEDILENEYHPSLIALIYQEATPKKVLENPFDRKAKAAKKPGRHGGSHEKGREKVDVPKEHQEEAGGAAAGGAAATE